MQGMKAQLDRCWKQSSAGGPLGAKDANHVFGRESAPLTLQPGVSEPSSEVARLDRGCHSQPESALIFLDWMIRSEAMLSHEMAGVNCLEDSPTQSARDVLHPFAGLPSLCARHLQILEN